MLKREELIQPGIKRTLQTNDIVLKEVQISQTPGLRLDLIIRQLNEQEEIKETAYRGIAGGLLTELLQIQETHGNEILIQILKELKKWLDLIILDYQPKDL